MSPSSSKPQDAFKRPRGKPPVVKIGDTVRIGKGRTEYTVTGFCRMGTPDQTYAELKFLDGYGHATATLDRLTVLA